MYCSVLQEMVAGTSRLVHESMNDTERARARAREREPKAQPHTVPAHTDKTNWKRKKESASGEGKVHYSVDRQQPQPGWLDTPEGRRRLQWGRTTES